SNREHIQNIRTMKAEIEQNICPRCGKPLVKRNGPKGSFWGCSGYPNCKFTKND
ncbi:MAG: topoisomerase DNA-binding C4 zinc finger domain-containing protein, partial [Clostridia bacterium]|nr:topoisomerase DNA-binding C4 zinc finger domain-containing protein [Clostridia bacterium]